MNLKTFVFYRSSIINAEVVSLLNQENYFVWQANLKITDLNLFPLFQIKDPIFVVIQDKDNNKNLIFNLVITEKRRNCTDNAHIVQIVAHSPAILLKSPFFNSYNSSGFRPQGNATAKNIVWEIIEEHMNFLPFSINLHWEILDWYIPDDRLDAYEDPISAINHIVQACGGTIESLPNGDIRIRYKYPVSPTFYKSQKGIFDFSTQKNILTWNDEIIYLNEKYNSVIVSDGEQSSRQATIRILSLKEIGEEDKTYIAEIGVYLYPEEWDKVQLIHSGNGCINIEELGIEEIYVKETVCIHGNQATTSAPVYELIGYTWIKNDLGAITYKGFNIYTEKEGITFCELVYKTKRKKYKITTKEKFKLIVSVIETTTGI